MDFTGTVAGAFLACNVGMLGRTQLRVQLDESGSATCTFFYWEPSRRKAGHYNLDGARSL